MLSYSPLSVGRGKIERILKSFFVGIFFLLRNIKNLVSVSQENVAAGKPVFSIRKNMGIFSTWLCEL